MTDSATVKLHIRELGGSGPTAVLLHGLFGSGDNLAGLGAALTEGHRVLLVDLRNHGRSEWGDNMTLSAMAADVVAMLDRLDVQSLVLVGHSLGGKVAMQVALQYPDRVAALVVVDIAPVRYAPSHEPVFKGLAAVDLDQVSRRADADQMLSRYVAEPMVRGFLLKSLTTEAPEQTGSSNRQSDARSSRFRWRFNWHALQNGYAELSAAPDDGRFKGPVLVIQGGDSGYVRAEHQAAIQQLFPAAEMRTIAGAGHWLHAEKPVEFNGLVRRWLSRLDC